MNFYSYFLKKVTILKNKSKMQIDDLDKFLPSAFGKKSKLSHNNPKHEKELIKQEKQEMIFKSKGRQKLPEIGPSLPKRTEKPMFPITQEFQIGEKSNSITTIFANKEGTRLYTGGNECTICYYNLNGMDVYGRKCESIIKLNDSFTVNSIDVSENGNKVAVATGSPQIKIFDSKGLRKQTSKRGDMYLYDATNTEGHTAAVTCLQFKPEEDATLASVSLDGTLRFWRSDRLDVKPLIYRLSAAGGVRNPAYGMCWSPDAKGVYVAASDGFISYFTEKITTRSASFKIDCRKEGNGKTTIPGSVIVVNDNQICVKEYEGTCLMLWDIRNPDKSIWTHETISRCPCINIGPNQTVLVPESIPRGSKRGGMLKFVSLENGETIEDVSMPHGIGVNAAAWNEETNQIFCGCSDGITRVLLDNEISKGGVMNALDRVVTFNKETDEAAIGSLLPKLVDPSCERIIKGFWFPFTSESVSKRREEQLPKAPIFGEGYKGQLGVASYQRELIEVGEVGTPDDVDIVESIRSHDKAAKVGYFTGANEIMKAQEYDDLRDEEEREKQNKLRKNKRTKSQE